MRVQKTRAGKLKWEWNVKHTSERFGLRSHIFLARCSLRKELKATTYSLQDDAQHIPPQNHLHIKDIREISIFAFRPLEVTSLFQINNNHVSHTPVVGYHAVSIKKKDRCIETSQVLVARKTAIISFRQRVCVFLTDHRYRWLLIFPREEKPKWEERSEKLQPACAIDCESLQLRTRGWTTYTWKRCNGGYIEK